MLFHRVPCQMEAFEFFHPVPRQMRAFEHLHGPPKLLIHSFGRPLVELCGERLRHDVLALRELAEQPL